MIGQRGNRESVPQACRIDLRPLSHLPSPFFSSDTASGFIDGRKDPAKSAGNKIIEFSKAAAEVSVDDGLGKVCFGWI